jgi:hypothetical protein
MRFHSSFWQKLHRTRQQFLYTTIPIVIKTNIISLHSANWLVFITDIHCVLCEVGIELLYTSMVGNNRWTSVFKRLKRNFKALWSNPSLLKMLFILLHNMPTLLSNDHDTNRWTVEIAFDITKAVICEQCGSTIWTFDAMNIIILSQKLFP